MPCPTLSTCKQGSCSKCGSACKRHCCACDGLDPAEKTLRKRGGQPKEPMDRRKSFKKAVSRVGKKVSDDLLEETSVRGLTSAKDDPVTNLWRYHQWSFSTKKNLPSKAKREADENLMESDVKGWSTIVESVRAAAHSAANVLFPCNPDKVLKSVADKELENNSSTKTLEENVIEVYNKARKNSIVKRAMRAVIVKSLTRRRIQELKTAEILKLGGNVRHKSTQDFTKLLEGDDLKVQNHSKARFKLENLRLALLYMLHESNIGVLSWGTKIVALSSSERYTLPRIVRRKTEQDIYQSYVRENSDESKRIGRSTFYKILKIVTSGGEKMATAVDYVTGVLIHDQVDRLQDLIEHFSRNAEVKNSLTLSLELVRNMYKHHVDKHIVLQDDCSYHGVKYGLSKHENEAQSMRGTKCNGCLYPFVFRKNLLAEINRTLSPTATGRDRDLAADAKTVLEDIMDKFELYRGHRVRVANQQKAHQAVHTELAQWCLDNKRDCPRAVLVADWKMKFVPLSARETTQEHFAKRGIGWHGFLLYL